jgi:hypothetical protein
MHAVCGLISRRLSFALLNLDEGEMGIPSRLSAQSPPALRERGQGLVREIPGIKQRKYSTFEIHLGMLIPT